ncbi:MAG: FAD-dependent oxidoreductase, partial [Alphaproteobacteria bacterium]
MPRTTITPDDGDTNGWYNILPEASPPRRVDGDMSCDWAVVGAGVTGLAAARRLAENRPDDRVFLIEGQRVGWGVSGRNSGFVLGIWFHGEPPEADFPKIRSMQRLSEFGRDQLKHLVEHNQISCQWSDWGQLYVSAGDTGDAMLEGYARGMEKLQAPHSVLSKEEVKTRTGSDFYRWGVHTPGTALMNPAAMTRGLARTMPANVTVLEESPVMAMRYGKPHELTCPKGTIKATNIVICTNTYSPHLGLMWAKWRMVPAGLFASLTRPLSDQEWEGIGAPGEAGLLPSAPAGSTVRITQDRRILMRNTFDFLPKMRATPEMYARARANHYESILRRWPSLKDVEIIDTWHGVLGPTRNQGHIFGRIRDNVFASVACNAANVSRGTAS